MRFDEKNSLHLLVMGGLLAALIAMLTIVVAIPVPGLTQAYVNLGDAGVYLAAFVLGSPWGALSAAVGSGLADILLGSMLYAGPTFVIKGLMALLAACLIKRMQGKTVFALLIAGLVMPIGYLLFEAVYYGGFDVALVGLLPNMAQYAVGVALGYPITRIAKTLLKKTS